MNERIFQVMNEMFLLYAGDPKRMQHFTKVYVYASWIGQAEQLDEQTQEILEIAALTHDIGIHLCEEKYGQCGGKLQEREGPALAKTLLQKLGIEDTIQARVLFLIAHHHTYSGVDGPDWQILLEADFLVNAYEDALQLSAIQHAYHKIFRTASGKRLCQRMFALNALQHD